MIYTDSTEKIYVGLSVWEKESLPTVKNEILDFLTHTLDFSKGMDSKQLTGVANILRIVRDMEIKGNPYILEVTANEVMEVTSAETKMILEDYQKQITALEEKRTALELEMIDNILTTK